MSVYVDKLKPVRIRAGHCGTRTKLICHLTADSLVELEAFRKRLGLYKKQRLGCHYNLSPDKRKQAIDMGAKVIPEDKS